jgi:peptidoglycan/LPS O-acetylase OafA/YrhL
MKQRRFLPSGGRAGSAPGDREFRPDVQGLRAVAILLVVLFHADVPRLGGGFVGVDVFFVISGFVITGLLLRERETTGSTSIPRFYARRVRRIIPMATLVIIVVVIASYHFLGAVDAGSVANDGKWASIFLANVHFAAEGTNYLSATAPPSPLQNYWSLAVEEQFYLVYPALFLLITWRGRHSAVRSRMVTVLLVVIGASLALSVLQTGTNPAVAFFSPLTRAWELALGGLVALSTGFLRRLPRAAGAGLSWLGIAAVVVSGFVFTTATPYPGSAVVLPVVGTALVIAGGTARPAWGAELLLGRRPLQWLGLISYSLYLWHWPILIIAAERRGSTTLPLSDNLLLLLVALALSIVSYLLIENPFRHWSFLVSRRWVSIALGACLVAATLGVTLAQNQKPYQEAREASSLVNEAPGSSCPSPLSSDVNLLRNTLKITGAQTVTPPRQLMVVGDSTACTMLAGLEALGPYYGFQIVNAAVVGCGVITDKTPQNLSPGVDVNNSYVTCSKRVEAAQTTGLARSRPSLVLWSSQWEKDSIVIDTGHGPQTLVAGTPAWKSVLMRQMEQRVAEFTAHGAKVVLLTQPAFQDPPGVKRPTASDESYLQLNQLLTQFAEQHRNDVYLINLAAHVCPGGPPCPAGVDGVWVRPDGLHYGPAGALFVARWLFPQLLSGPLHLSTPAPVASTVPAPRTVMVDPSNGSTVSGEVAVAATVADNLKVAKAEVWLVSKGKDATLIGTAEPAEYTWNIKWNSTTVPNGVYGLYSVVWDVRDDLAKSKTVTVHVDN